MDGIENTTCELIGWTKNISDISSAVDGLNNFFKNRNNINAQVIYIINWTTW